MSIIISLLAIYGLAFAIKETNGPWGVLSWARNKLMTNKHVGVFFYQLLSCYFCVGFWCGVAVYLLMVKDHLCIWDWDVILCHGLAGGVACLLIDGLLNRMNRE